MLATILFPILLTTKIAFLGDSITYGWKQYRTMIPVKTVIINGKIGANSKNALYRLNSVLSEHPNKIFIMIGINEIDDGSTTILNNIKKMIIEIREKEPFCYIYIQSILPTRSETTNHKVMQTNLLLKSMVNDMDFVKYIDLYSHFTDSSGKLIKNFTEDGLHLTHCGYSLWNKILMNEVFR